MLTRVLPRFQNQEELRLFLLDQADRFESPDFIEADPISIPHRFSRREDREIAGLFAALLAWGQRKTILSSMSKLLDRMDRAPFDFIRYHRAADLKRMEGFVHRTFQDTDLLFLIQFLQEVYQNGGMEAAFFPPDRAEPNRVENGLERFRTAALSHPDFPRRTAKHLASPRQGSACKRLNMFLRWMVRSSEKGVDFGLWQSVSPAELICPCDVHVERVARELGLMEGQKANWNGAVFLTDQLRQFDPTDPVRFDFALFGLGISSRSVQTPNH